MDVDRLQPCSIDQFSPVRIHHINSKVFTDRCQASFSVLLTASDQLLAPQNSTLDKEPEEQHSERPYCYVPVMLSQC